MQLFRADLHIHSGCSPSADLEMSPSNIIQCSIEKGLHIIGITDHNCTKQVRVIAEMAEKSGLFVLPGAEITTKENVHSLVFMPSLDDLSKLQELIDRSIIKIKNNPKVYGYQVIVDEEDNLVEEIPDLLIAPLDVGFFELAQWVHQQGGIFVPAHVDRPVNGMLMHYGRLPQNFEFDAIEVSTYSNAGMMFEEHPSLATATIIRSSDSHVLKTIGNNSTIFSVEKIDFNEIKLAMNKREGRSVL